MYYEKGDILNRIKYILKRWAVLLLALLILLCAFTFRMRKVIFLFAKSSAENILLNASNEAVLNVFENNNIKYEQLSHVSRDTSGAVTDIQIDTALINTLKAEIASEMYKLTKKDKYTLNIPLGTLLNNEFTSGYGPSLKFNMSLAHSASVSFESRFTAAGINNCLHSIIIVTDIDCSVLSFGSTRKFTFQNEVIAVQSLIAGGVPESYTSVYETDPTQYADDVFNYSK